MRTRLNPAMRWFWLVAVLVGCTKPNPLYCDSNTDCTNGTFCNLESHGCEQQQVDAAIDSPPIDAPFVARTIADIRAPSTAPGTPVDLSGVVVTAVDQYGGMIGDFWIQTAGGGRGVRVYGAPAADVATLAVGDVVDISSARKYRYLSDTTGRFEIEVVGEVGTPIKITKVGTSQTPVATQVDLSMIANLPQPQLGDELDGLAGAYVVVNQQRSTEVPRTVSFDTGFDEFTIDAIVVRSTLSAFPSGIMEQTCFTSIRGVMTYQRGYALLPPRTSDVVIGSGCL